MMKTDYEQQDNQTNTFFSSVKPEINVLSFYIPAATQCRISEKEKRDGLSISYLIFSTACVRGERDSRGSPVRWMPLQELQFKPTRPAQVLWESRLERPKPRLAYTNFFPLVGSFGENWRIIDSSWKVYQRWDTIRLLLLQSHVKHQWMNKKNSALHSPTYQFLWKSYLLILLFPQSNHSLSLAMNEIWDHGHFAFCRTEPNPHTSLPQDHASRRWF